ncbi:hypothetical protein HPULCUR_000500 [Helicostylum pulchrum]|uniref:F-box domain-containing protein n=1 Tax=Helicostylum pulchrum TaxID=562976 RepID=A0ABP9XK28_9FUNG
MSVLLPSELLELIGSYLSQLNSQQSGLLVRSVSFRKSKNRVGVTSNELDQLAVVCPYLEVLDFDQAVWKYIRTCNLDQFTYVHRLPPFTLVNSIPTQLVVERLDQLSLHGAIVSDLFQQQLHIMTILKNTPCLSYLSLNSQQDKSHAIYISVSEMDAIHDFCPLLKELVLVGSFKLMHAPHHITQQQVQVPPKKSNFMRRFSLNALLAPHWIYYFAYKYPHLQHIDFELMNDTITTTKAMPKKEIQKLFSVLLESCPNLNKIELDSLSAKTYMTSDFFDTADRHGLKEIKMKDLPYCLVSRQDNFFDFIVNRGRRLISGLGTEVIESDLHITRILQPLAKLKRLTELVLCCGHPYFDCELDLVLDHCPNLIQLTIRSAHVTLSDTQQQQLQQQHGLKSLSFSTVSFSSAVFDYLAIRCDSLTRLVCYECDQKQGNVIRMHMPQHTFETVIINGIRMGSFDQPNARIMSIAQGENSRWYHAYHRNNTCSPKMRRLNHRQTQLAQQYYYYNQQQPLLNQVWHQDLSLGYISIQCRSIKHWEFICDTTFEF